MDKRIMILKRLILNWKLPQIAFLLFLLLPSLCYSDLYFWIDEKGVKHYSDTHPDSAHTTRLSEISPSTKRVEANRTYHPNQEINRTQKRPIPKPIVNIEYKYYDVIGVNINDLRSETIKHSPIKYKGTTFRGSAGWRMKPYYRAKERGGVWYLDNIAVEIDIKITMPKWQDYRKAHRDEQKRWDVYYEKLLKHEHNHRDIDIAAAEELCSALVELRTTAGKDSLLKLAAIRAKAVYRKCKKLNKQYDKETEHGRKEGIKL